MGPYRICHETGIFRHIVLKINFIMLLYVVIRPIISNSVVEAEVGWGEERCRQLNFHVN